MADDTGSTDATKPKVAPKDMPPAADDGRRSVAYWQERARSVFGVSPHLFAGAMYGREADQLTEQQVQELIAKFSSRPAS